MHPLVLIIGLAAIITGASAYKRRRGRPAGSQTNASDAMDDIHVPANPTHDELLDAGVKETFPASDPVSVSQPSETAYEKQQRKKRSA
ncbi:MAG TPA: hypothetical protein VI321_02280 [Burkholderiales bacterium]